MKKILLFALMTFFVQTSFCQNLSDTVNVEYSKNSPKRISFGISLPTLGALWTISPNLNSFLDKKGISTRNYAVAVPLIASYQVNKFKLNLEVYYGIPDDPSKRGFTQLHWIQNWVLLQPNMQSLQTAIIIFI